MNSSKGIMKALVFSIMTTVLCVGMLAGTTFAWFTDTATNSGNKITAGTLSVDFTWTNSVLGQTDTDLRTVGLKVYEENNWQPGESRTDVFKVTNTGTIGIKYRLTFLGLDLYTDGDVCLGDVISVTINGAGAGKLSDFAAGEVIAEGDIADQGYFDEITVTLTFDEGAGNEYQDMPLTVGDEGFDIHLAATQITNNEF